MRQLGGLTAMTPAVFFGLAFLAVAGTCAPARMDVTVSPVSCRTGRTTVTLSAREELDRRTGFTVYRDGRAVHEGRIGPKGRRTVTVGVEPGGSALVTVKIEGQSGEEQTVRSSCGKPGPHPAGVGDRPSRETGKPSASLRDRALTVGGVILTGCLVWWFGSVWPGRTPRRPIDPNRSPYGPRRYPGLKI